MGEFERLVADDFRITGPLVALLVLASILDVLGGITLAVVAKVATSTVAREGIARKILALLVVASFALIDGFLPRIVLPIVGETTWAGAVAMFMFTWEVLSLLEKAGLMGLPIGPLKGALKKVRDGLSGGLADSANPAAEESPK